MTDTVEISRYDWDKLIGYHEELEELVNGLQGELESVLMYEIPQLHFRIGAGDISLDMTHPISKRLSAYYAKFKPWMKFLIIRDYPFGITPREVEID